jgi:hypothetical protein
LLQAIFVSFLNLNYAVRFVFIWFILNKFDFLRLVFISFWYHHHDTVDNWNMFWWRNVGDNWKIVVVPKKIKFILKMHHLLNQILTSNETYGWLFLNLSIYMLLLGMCSYSFALLSLMNCLESKINPYDWKGI